MHRQPIRCHQSGFTLVEVLVTVLILSIGLLGIAALQTATMRGTQSAFFRSQAAALGHQVADAMRANRDVALAAGYDTGFGDTIGACNATASIAQCDLGDIKTALTQRLPNGQVRVAVAPATNIATVCVRWDQPQRENDIAASTSAAGCGGVPARKRQFEFETVL